jgi:signal transduction histidine kinase
MLNEILNTCLIAAEAAPNIRTIAGYSHIIPVVLSLILGIFVFVKAKYNFFSKMFLAFIVVFSLWLIGDVIAWTSNNYHLVYTTWSFLLYLEIVFYVLGLYFAVVFVKKTDITIVAKVVLLIATLPPLWLTISQQSVLGFNQPICEAFNNSFLDTYKLAVEGVILLIILIYSITPFFEKLSWDKIKPNLTVLGSMFLLLSTFGVTEYLASVTGYYEMNLYSLFLLPVFLVAIIYSVFELDIFNFHILGTHYLVVGLVVVMGGQLFFITNTTNKLLTVIAIIIAACLSIILFRNLKRESDQRVQIAKLNIDLGKLIEQRESLVHLVTHKVKGSFTRSKYIFAGILDGSFGDISPEIKKYAAEGLESDNLGIETVDLVLNAGNLQKGAVKYDMKPLDFKEVVKKIVEEKKVQAEARGLKIETNLEGGVYNVMGDVFWLKEAINNLIENSIKYTKKGEIKIELHDGDGKVRLSVKDTGIGITDEDKKTLFTEGGRGKDSVKVNVDSTGYGLYTVKLVIEAHKGKVWAESEGADKGSTFYVEMDAVQ